MIMVFTDREVYIQIWEINRYIKYILLNGKQKPDIRSHSHQNG